MFKKILFATIFFLITAAIIAGAGLYFVKQPSALAQTANTYYIDATSGNNSNPGTQSQPWLTIQYAANTVVAGDTVIVKPGTYPERVSTVNSGNANNRITYRAEGVVSMRGWIIASGDDYTTIEGFEITGITGNGQHGVRAYGDNCEILNNTIHSLSAYINLAGIATEAVSENCSIIGNILHDIGNEITQNITVRVRGSGHIFENNELYNNGCDAFRALGTNLIFRGNYLHDFYENGGCHTDVIQMFSDAGDSFGNVLFENNFIKDFDGQIFMIDDINNLGIGNLTFRNNVYENIRSAARSYNQVNVYNNIFYRTTMFGCTGYCNSWAISLTQDPGRGSANGSNIYNNIIWTEGNSTTGWYNAAGGILINADYNLVYPNKSNFSETNGINGSNPLFVNRNLSDFKLQATSSAINKGTTIGNFSSDKDDVSRPQGFAWDIGAYEYVQVPPPPPPLTGDFNSDSKVNDLDFSFFKNAFKSLFNAIFDLNSDSAIDVKDLGVLMSSWLP